MKNKGRSKVFGKENIELAFTSSKVITLTNVLHVPDMNQNLVSRGTFGKN